MLFHSLDAAKQAGLTHLMLVGRRQPMHIGHLASIRQVIDAQMVPIIVIGSCNEKTRADGTPDPLFDPVANPLTLAQQYEQLKAALPEGASYLTLAMPDLGDNPRWCERLAAMIPPAITPFTGLHFIGRETEKKYHTSLRGEAVHGYFWQGNMEALGIAVVELPPHPQVSLSLSATQLRQMDLERLTPAQKALFATPDYLLAQAREARSHFPERQGLPLTLAELTLRRQQ